MDKRYLKNNRCSITDVFCYISDDMTDRFVDCRNCNVPIIHFLGGVRRGQA